MSAKPDCHQGFSHQREDCLPYLTQSTKQASQKKRLSPVKEFKALPGIIPVEEVNGSYVIDPSIMDRRSEDELDGGSVGHVADNSFDSWFAAVMNRNRNEERDVHVGGHVSLSDEKPGNVN